MAVGSGVFVGVSLGGLVAVCEEVGVADGKGVKVVVAVGGAKVGDGVLAGRVADAVGEGDGVAESVTIAAVGVALGVGVAVAAPGALRIATIPAQ